MFKEWPLVAFTILGQMGVGVFLLTCCFLSVGEIPPSAGSRRTLLLNIALALGLLILAALVSFFHLRHPFRARRVLSNLRTSWLSREILFELGFIGLAALAGFLTWRDAEWGASFTAVLTAACVAGALFWVSMSKLYMLPTLPAWNTAFTPLSFAMTTLILGALGLAMILRASGGSWDTSALLLRLSLIALAGEIVIAVRHAARHKAPGPGSQPSLRPPDSPPRRLHGARLLAFALGSALVGAALIANDVRILAAAFTLILAGEVLGRFLFYGRVTRPGR